MNIDQIIDQKPEVVLYLSSAYKSYDYFLSRINGLIKGVYSGRIQSKEFNQKFSELIRSQLRNAYQQAWIDEGYSGAIPGYLSASCEKLIAKQISFLKQFYADIAYARKHKLPIKVLLDRARLWAQRWKEAYNEAVRLITLNSGGKLKWLLGRTEKHCPECKFLNGKVLLASEWNKLKLRPQNAPNPKLSCGGWRCDCSLVPTDERRTRNGFNLILLASPLLAMLMYMEHRKEKKEKPVENYYQDDEDENNL